ncbi:MAG: hypothetical protein WAM25_01535, partial [Candidatus Acidiferrales bacterium]
RDAEELQLTALQRMLSICVYLDAQKRTYVRSLHTRLHPDSCFLNPNNRKMKESVKAARCGKRRLSEAHGCLYPRMNIEQQQTGFLGEIASNRRFCLRVGVLLLLVAIAGFATLAKNSQYYSKSDPAHYINISSKMKVAAVPAVVDRAPLLRHLEGFALPLPRLRVARVVRAETPPLPSIGVTVSLQHRSPPVVLS